MAAAAYRFTEHAVYDLGRPQEGDGREAVGADPAQDRRPARRARRDRAPARGRVDADLAGRDATTTGCSSPARTGCSTSPRGTLLDHTPAFFNATSVPFDYDPTAGPPTRWLSFLGELWPDDRESAAALQEWFGYVISGRLDLHKILLLVGPTRAGKGVTARILGALVGDENVAGPTLSSLNGDFGLAPLLGKTLAVVSDARLNGRNASVVVERLLSISGEDTLTVNRKYREQWTGKLPTRLMVCSNELPQLGDASMAIAGRFVPLLLTRSWLGKEDHELEPDASRRAARDPELVARRARTARRPRAGSLDRREPTRRWWRCRTSPRRSPPSSATAASATARTTVARRRAVHGLARLGRGQRAREVDEAGVRPRPTRRDPRAQGHTARSARRP